MKKDLIDKTAEFLLEFAIKYPDKASFIECDLPEKTDKESMKNCQDEIKNFIINTISDGESNECFSLIMELICKENILYRLEKKFEKLQKGEFGFGGDWWKNNTRLVLTEFLCNVRLKMFILS